MAEGAPILQHLAVHHGKTGHGLGIDFAMRQGPVTLVNWTQFDAGGTFKLIYTTAEVISGEILHIGNPNCRVRIEKPIPQFMDEWCRGPACTSRWGWVIWTGRSRFSPKRPDLAACGPDRCTAMAV